MEDFGYSKKQEETSAALIIKRAFLIGATLFSIACFVYVTINAYNFVNQNEKDIETIFPAADPIKIIEEEKSQDENLKIDNSIYEDIFGNKKHVAEKEVKIRESIEQSSDNSKKNLIDKKESSKSENSKPEKIAENKNQVEQISTLKQTQNQENSAKNIAEKSPEKNIVQKNNERKFVKVQIGALTSKSSANDYLKRLQELYPELFSGLKSFIEEADLGKRGKFYRLQIGNFFDQIRAEEFCNKYIRKTGKNKAECIVVE